MVSGVDLFGGVNACCPHARNESYFRQCGEMPASFQEVYVMTPGADPGNLKGGLFHRCSQTHF